MRMVELNGASLGPGDLFLWRPVAAAAPLEESAAPPSYVQEQHLQQCDARRMAGVTQPRWAGVAVDLPGRLDHDVLSAALSAVVRRHDSLSCTFRVERGEAQRLTVPIGTAGFAVENLGTAASGAEAASRLIEAFDRWTEPFVWPAFLFAAVARESGWTLLFAADRVHADLYSLGYVAHEMVECYEAGAGSRPARLLPSAVYSEYCAAERVAAPDDRARDAAARRWLDLAEAAGGTFPGFPVDLGGGPDQPHPAAYREIDLADAATAERFERWCRDRRGGLTSGLAAAVAHACAARDRFHAVLALQTRPSPAKSAIGWYVNAVPLTFAVADTNTNTNTNTDTDTDTDTHADFAGTLLAAQRAMLSGYRDAQTPYSPVTDQLPEKLGFEQACWLSLADFRHLPGADRHAEWNLRAVAAPRHTTGGDLWINRVDRGLAAHIRFPGTDEAHRAVTTFVDSLTAIIAGIADLGDVWT
ncbi:hypothetical protein ABH926_007776 [Catenulispora sp. GP43]|uniref:condensation domain-containing protein n=1 Tax=Catenulispora sp. GP43 TaxID=3156263 RepID=UPI003519968D